MTVGITFDTINAYCAENNITSTLNNSNKGIGAFNTLGRRNALLKLVQFVDNYPKMAQTKMLTQPVATAQGWHLEFTVKDGLVVKLRVEASATVGVEFYYNR